MINTKQKRIIDNAYYKIDYVLSKINWVGIGKELFDLIKSEEVQHRKFCPDGIKITLPVVYAVKLFYVQGIIQGLSGKLNYTIKDYLSIRKSVLVCQCITENYNKELFEALEFVNFQEILDLDYAELMKE